MTNGIVLASATSPTEQAIFDELVHRGIEYDLPSPYLASESGEMTHLWPVPEPDHLDPSSIAEGDYVLFYRGSNRYSWAARVHKIIADSNIADRLADHIDQRSGHNIQPREEFSETVLVLEIPIPIDLESYRLHELLNVGQDALTRTVVPDDSVVANVVDEYGSIEQLLQSARDEPSVYIELTSIDDKPYKQPDGEYPLGSAVFSRSESKNGHDIYGTLREPQVGDIVLHILKDKRKLYGISTVASTLQTDFEGPPDGSWESEARGEGYFLPLGGYEEFPNPIDIDDRLLQNEEYRDRLKQIYEENSGLVYDKNYQFAQGAYFTECPLDLLYLFTAELPHILTVARQRFWDVPQPANADQYDSVSEAVVDVRIRLPFGDRGREWFLNSFAGSIVEAFTESLSSVQPNAELTQTEATHCELIRRLYTDWEDEFAEAADHLGVGRTNQVGDSETLFFVLFRELQESVGVSTNMNQVKTRTILNKNYEIESPILEDPLPDDSEPLEPAEKPERADEIARQLLSSKQMVFYGPPGTGKTYTARRFARWWLNQQDEFDPHIGQLDTVTFHPSFTYEDFIEGLSVDTTEDGSVKYEEVPGVFLEFANKARQEYYATPDDEEPRRYVLVIDEINRGNLAQIFGETITGLEADKRLGGDDEASITLAHSGDQFTIPPNLYLIGTMNTADRSIALVDAALRRRFRFLAFPPNLDLLRDEFGLGTWEEIRDIATSPTSDQQLLSQSLIAIHLLNKRIRNEPDLGRGKQIGHSFLFGVETEQDIVDTWRFEILPLLEEYFFGQYERIRESLFSGDGDELFDWSREQIKPFGQDDLSRALAPFVPEFDPEEAETVN